MVLPFGNEYFKIGKVQLVTVFIVERKTSFYQFQ